MKQDNIILLASLSCIISLSGYSGDLDPHTPYPSSEKEYGTYEPYKPFDLLTPVITNDPPVVDLPSPEVDHNVKPLSKTISRRVKSKSIRITIDAAPMIMMMSSLMDAAAAWYLLDEMDKKE